jgi:response regulator of citrate/malate metabolism
MVQHITNDFTALQTTFKQRYAMSDIDKFRKSKEILHRTQASSESVDDYIAWIQSAAEKVDLPESALKQAITQGLRPNMRVFVLHSEANTLSECLQVARTSETAHAETTSTPQQFDELTAKLDMWMSQQQANISKQEDSISSLP